MKQYIFQIAGCRFEITSEYVLDLNKEEVRFLVDNADCCACEPSMTVHTAIHHAEKAPYELKHTDYSDRSLETVQTILNGYHCSIRSYYADIRSDRPFYAQSCYIPEEHKLDICICNDKVWSDVNLRIWNLLHLEQILLSSDAFILHYSYMMYNNEAILFSAPSGTGKTTQAKLWEKYYHSRIINGDKAVVRRKNGIWSVCGYPYHGSAEECENKEYPLRAVVAVRQSPDDYVVCESAGKRVMDLYSESTVNHWDESSVTRLLDLLSDLVMKNTVVKQYCTMNPSAPETLYRYLYGDK